VINDGKGLLLIVEKQPTGNTLEVTKNVEKAIEDLKPELKGVDIDPTIFRHATFIEHCTLRSVARVAGSKMKTKGERRAHLRSTGQLINHS
jgi:multidrug efflux pump subunit AcrB